MRTAIVNGSLLTPYRELKNSSLLVEDGKIAGIFPAGAAPGADLVVDAGGCYISPGFIDIHTHGGGGFDFMDGTPEAFIGAAKFHMRHGTTAIVPTTLSSADAEMHDAFKGFRLAKRGMEDGPELLGLHLEGPYFSMEQKGVQDPAYLKNPSSGHYLELLSASEDIVRWSAAPELPGGLELGDALRKRGILAAIGHSNATYQEVLAAFDHGYTHVTHMYSGMSTIRRIQAFRYLGVVESAYLIDDMTVEIIADGKHLPPELLKLILRCKPWDMISLITDSMRCAGMAEGTVQFIGSKRNGQEVIVEDGVAKMPDRSCFAGSTCTADRCVRTMHQLAELPLKDAVRMMTLNPARVMGVGGRKGALAPGMDADICIFDESVNIRIVMCAGKVTVDSGKPR